MRKLKKVKFRRKIYYLDKRLKQLRNVKNPYDTVNLNAFEVLYYSKKKFKLK